VITAGSAWPAYGRAVHRAWRDAGGDGAARAAVVASVVDLGCPGAWPAGGPRVTAPTPPPALVGPDLPGLVLEALLDPSERRRSGRHHTPAAIADGVVALAIDLDRERHVASVCDPAVGGGAFLLAFVRAAVAAGVGRADAVARCHGCDLDPLAVEVTRAALRWAGGDDGVVERIVVADGLDTGRWARRFDLVVGNPPFQGQLGRDTARRPEERRRAARALGREASGYVDTAGLFLVAGCELAGPGGTVAMLMPEGLLSARDAAPVRERVAASGRLRAAWVAGEPVFEAAVRVWAPVVDVGAAGSASAEVEVRSGTGFAPAGRVVLDGPSWAALLAPVHRTPAVAGLTATGRLADVATATAGFRHQFYGLVPYVEDGGAGPPLVTSGAIDPLSSSWRERLVRYARRDWKRPAVDLDRLTAGDPVLGRWVADRLVPKVLVASQTRVVEALPDPAGHLVPSVPVVAVACDAATVWAVAAALSAPPISAWALHRAGGAALTADAVKLSARQVLEVPLPADRVLWDEVAVRLADGGLAADEFARLMTRAYGRPDDDPVVAWWLARLPSWPPEGAC
jgi:predicted RNA methylase